ncbi:hypothetical protein ElyMa_003404600 [Elysia marginata]|uniref:G-protein coupled receptors family 1 profile domain-containing protein n=1 Tax=Elysia marginata TaxID=1093978 RepID=A0AAV4JRM5_9GAST|nr:hypothetical protein ElyMa_003404600 [Elysia marginata]
MDSGTCFCSKEVCLKPQTQTLKRRKSLVALKRTVEKILVVAVVVVVVVVVVFFSFLSSTFLHRSCSFSISLPHGTIVLSVTSTPPLLTSIGFYLQVDSLKMPIMTFLMKRRLQYLPIFTAIFIISSFFLA